MTMDERIEAAARAIGRLYCQDEIELEEGWADIDVRRHNWLLDARAAIAAAFPEFTRDKPTHWIAPMAATEEMKNAIAFGRYMTTSYGGDDSFDYISEDNASEMYGAMRDAYLGKGDGG